MVRTAVTGSSNIVSVGYDADDEVLEVEFKRGVYQYKDVPPILHQQLMDAQSKGEFFRKHIQGFYSYVRIGDPF